MVAEYEFTVRAARWEDDAAKLTHVREHVFIVEQKVPAHLEWDGLDPACAHVLAEASDGEAPPIRSPQARLREAGPGALPANGRFTVPRRHGVRAAIRGGRRGRVALPATWWLRHERVRATCPRAIATGRLSPDGQIGRMAVLREWRGKGVGSAVVDALVTEARRQGFTTIYLHAQMHAQRFYAKHGFETVGAPFDEAGIPHIEMIKRLPAEP